MNDADQKIIKGAKKLTFMVKTVELKIVPKTVAYIL